MPPKKKTVKKDAEPKKETKAAAKKRTKAEQAKAEKEDAKVAKEAAGVEVEVAKAEKEEATTLKEEEIAEVKLAEAEAKEEEAAVKEEEAAVKEEVAEEKEEKAEEKDVETKDAEEKEETEEKKEEGKEKADTKKTRKRKQHPAAEGNRPKRERKSIQDATYQPVDFTTVQNSVRIFRGRGTKLRDIESVNKSITSHAASSDAMAAAHRLLYSYRGRVAKKEMKHNILEFSGYLKHIPEGADPKKVESEDEDDETKYSTKAFKLTIAELKDLCDFFNVDRTSEDKKPMGKEDLIDRLLDFLGAPDEGLTKATEKKGRKRGPKKTAPKKTAKKAKAGKKTAEGEDVSEDLSSLKSVAKGEMPSDDVLRQWVRAYVACFDMDTATTKHAIQTAKDKFGLDMSEKKVTIKDMLADEM